MSSAGVCAAAGHLLRVTVSRRGSASYSLRLLEEFTEEWTKAHPGKAVVTRDTFLVPHLDLDELTAGRTPLASQTPELRAAFALADEITNEAVHASAIVIATPMFNWGPPSSLKAWIDRLINTRTFYEKTATLAGIPITFIIASGGPYSVDAGTPSFPERDHLRPLLLEDFKAIGATDMVFVNCDPSGGMDRGSVDPADPASPFQRARGKLPAAAARIKA